MKKSYLGYFLLILILFNIFFSINAVGVTYQVDVNDNDIFLWEVDEYDEDTYENIVSFDTPDYDEDEQMKIQITNIEDKSNKWVISYDEWQYTDDTEDFNEGPNKEDEIKVYKDPEDKAENIIDIDDIVEIRIVATPFTNYIEDFRDNFDNPVINVFVDDDALVAKYAGETTQFQIELTFGTNGVVKKIEYVDSEGETFVEINLLEEEIIPGYTPIIIVLIITGFICIIIWKRKDQFSKGKI
ncbi:MAG: hypothetical protein GF383_13255 [Candidatus Lokiarchaeota archaeon]|nr:hypothetical protein [Candidatus Lokiarchaeota archaeon]MBD3342141.1 hypothetical protein [Candidatus Lokiarchaeota archaeon]